MKRLKKAALHQRRRVSMKIRESGMPDEETWLGFFDPASVLTKLGLTAACGDVVEFGCGYATFTIPVARIISGAIYAVDIEAKMIQTTQSKTSAAGLTNVRLCRRDFVAEGTGLADNTVDYAMLFNILHGESPTVLLREAYRVLVSGGKAGIIHWNYDPTTPRGPSMTIRPRPEQCKSWAEHVGFRLLQPGIMELPPYHYGIVLKKEI